MLKPFSFKNRLTLSMSLSPMLAMSGIFANFSELILEWKCFKKLDCSELTGFHNRCGFNNCSNCRKAAVIGNSVVVFVAIGLLLALTGDLKGFGIGASPLPVALLFAARTVATWAVVGLAVAAVLRPAPVVAAAEERAAGA